MHCCTEATASLLFSAEIGVAGAPFQEAKVSYVVLLWLSYVQSDLAFFLTLHRRLIVLLPCDTLDEISSPF